MKQSMARYRYGLTKKPGWKYVNTPEKMSIIANMKSIGCGILFYFNNKS
jgi:hypothetical protein